MRAFDEWRKLGDLGVTVSICYGPLGDRDDPRWTMLAMHRASGEEFDRPYVALNFEHAVRIAGMEAEARGWLERAEDGSWRKVPIE